MADGSSYRGLEIRIGADTSDLRKELKNVEAAASQAQRELRKVGKDLKMDPSSVTALRAQLQLTGDRAESLSAKLATMRKALRAVPDDAMARLRDSTYNVALETQRALRNYETLNATIEKVKREARELSKAAGVDFTKGMHAEELIGNLERADGLTREQARHVSELRERYDALAASQKEAHDVLDRANDVSKARGLTDEIGHTVTEVRQLSEQYSRLAAQRDVGKGLRGMRADAEACRSQMEALEREARGIDEALDGAGFRDSMRLISSRSQNLREQAQTEARLISDVNRQMDVLRSRWSGLESMPEGGLSNALVDARDAAARATEALRDQQGRVEALRAEWERLDAQQRNGEGVASRLSEVEGELRQATAQTDRLRAAAREAQSALSFREAQAELRSLSTAGEQATTRLRALNQTASSATSGMAGKVRSLGVSLTASVTPALSMAVQSVVDSSDRIDSAYRSMKKTTSGTEEDFQRILRDAIEMSKTQAVSADEILNIEALGGQMGIAADNVERFAQVVSNLDIATNVNSEDMSLILGQMSNILGLTSDEYQSFGDSIVRLGNNLPTQESNIAAITKRIGAMGTTVGMTGDQILGWAGAIAATGQNQEAAGTAISTTISQLENAVASGGDKLKAFAEVAGMSEQEFAQAWKTDASGAMQAFVEGLANVKASGGSVSQTLTDLGINGVRQRQALTGLATEVDNLDSSLRMSRDAWDGVDDEFGQAGDAAREAAQKSEGFSGALKTLQNVAQDLGYAFSDALTPMLQGLGDGLRAVEGAVRSLPDWAQRLTVTLAVVAAAAGPVLNAGGAIANFTKDAAGNLAELMTWLTRFTGPLAGLNDGLGRAGRTMSKLPGAVSKVGGAVSGALAAVRGLPGAFKLAGAGVAVLVAAFAASVVKAREHERAIEELSGGLRSFVDEAGNARKVEDGLSGISASLDDLASKADESFESARQTVSDWADEISSVEVRSELVDGYRDRIEELAGSVDGNAAKLSELQNAIRLYNSATGDSITITDDYTGAISKSTEELDANTEAFENNARRKAYSKVIDQAYEDMASAQVELEKLKDKAQDYVSMGLLGEDYSTNGIDDDLFGEKLFALGTDSSNKFHLYSRGQIDDAVKASDAIRETQAAIDGYQASIDAATAALDGLSSESEGAAAASGAAASGYSDSAGALQALADAIMGTSEAADGQTVSVDDAAASIDGYLQQARDAAEQSDDAAESSDDLASAATGIGEAMRAAGIDIDGFSEEMLDAALASGKSGRELIAYVGAVVQQRDAVQKAREEAKALSDAMDGDSALTELVTSTAGDAASFAKAMDDMGGSVEDFLSTYDQIASADPWSVKEITEDTQGYSWRMRDALNQTAQYYSDYATHLETVRKAAYDSGDQMAIDAVNRIQELGPESEQAAELLTYAFNETVQNGKEGLTVSLHDLGQAMHDELVAGGKAAAVAAGMSMQEMIDAAQAAVDAGEIDLSGIDVDADGLISEDEAAAWYEQAYGAGQDAGEGVIDGLDATDMTGAGNVLVTKTTDAVSQAEDFLKDTGKVAADQFARGMRDADISGPLGDFASRAGEAVRSAIDSQDMSNVTPGIVQAIRDQLTSVDSGDFADAASHVSSAVNSAVSQAVGRADAATADAGSGSDGGSAASTRASGIVGEIISGINSGIAQVSADDIDLAPLTSAVDGAEVPDGAFDGYASNFAQGVEDAVNDAVRGRTFNLSGLSTAISGALQGASGPDGGKFKDASGGGISAGVADGVTGAVQSSIDSIRASDFDVSGVSSAVSSALGEADYSSSGDSVRDAVADAVSGADWSGIEVDLGDGPFDEAGDSAGGRVVSAMKAAVEGADLAQTGSDAALHILQGALDKTGDASEAGRLLASNVSSGARGFDASPAGAALGEAFAQGVVSKTGLAYEAGRLLASNATSAMGAYAGSAYEYGVHYGSNFASGIASQVASVSAAATALAAAAAAPTHHSTPSVGPLKGDDEWGYEFGANIARGMVESTRLVARASTGMAQAMARSRAALAGPDGTIRMTLDDGAQRVAGAVDRLYRKVSSGELGATNNYIGDVSVNRGSDIADAIEGLARAITVEGRS